MHRSTFLKHIKNLDEQDLREELTLLFDKVEAVKIYYKMDLGSDSDRAKIYKKIKKEIATKYTTKSYRKPRRPRIQKVNLILGKIKKDSIFSHEIIDVYLFTVETAVHFMIEYDFYSEVLENNIVNTFTKVHFLIKDSRMEKEFDERYQKILVQCKPYYRIKKRIQNNLLNG